MRESMILVACLVVLVLAVWYEIRSPTPVTDPPQPRTDDARYAWRGTVLSNGKCPVVPVMLSNGVLIDAKCKSPQQWAVVHSDRKVFGSIDDSGNYIVEGIEQ